MSSKTFLLSGWEELHSLLLTGHHVNENCFLDCVGPQGLFCAGPQGLFCTGSQGLLCTNKIALKHEIYKRQRKIRVWNANSWFGIWHSDLSVGNFIGAMDYTIYSDHINIDYLCINDDVNVKLFENYKPSKSWSESESKQLVNSFICFLKKIAMEKQIPVIRKDVHQNRIFYDKYLLNNGFLMTGYRCIDKPYWVETELEL